MTDIVAIKDKGSAAQSVEPLFHGMGNGGFSGARKPCEPEIHRFVFIQTLSTGLGYCGMVPDYIFLLFSH
jgi:hypothetical protein